MSFGVAEPRVVSSWSLRSRASAAKEYPLGLPRPQRLRRSVDIQRVQRTGHRVRRRLLMMTVIRNGTSQTRVGLTVSRKVGNAVIRNRVKRWLREAIRQQRAHVPSGFDVVVIAHPQAARSSFDAIGRELAGAWTKVGSGQ